MSSESHLLLWSHAGRTLVGQGAVEVFDPGTGAGRYQKALSILRDSGHPVALASFTFDPDEEGSVVLVPASVIELTDWSEARHDMAPGKVTSDGVEEWELGATEALRALGRDLLEKVVVARQVEVEFDSEVPLRAVAHRLHLAYRDCYTFVVGGLVGSSPELLASLLDDEIASLALAGTGGSQSDLVSATLAVEHGVTASAVGADLSPHVTGMEQSGLVVEIGDIRHLGTLFRGRPVPGTTVLDVVASLHPTPAVAGRPREDSVRLIREIEPRSRGRYAGPVGWFGRDGEGEFAIALRCGLVEGNKATLYAGGGIVPGAILSQELDETGWKLRPMRAALGLE